MTTIEATQYTGTAPELASLRVLLVNEWLYTWGGSERCLDQLRLMMPQADILAGVVTGEMRSRHETAAVARESWVGRLPGARLHHRWLLPLHALAFSTFDTSGYDLVISISHAFEKAIRARKPRAAHLCYCLTPPRYLYDLKTSHERLGPPLQRFALRLTSPLLRAIDQRAARGVDHWVSLAAHVARRVKRAYLKDSAVVYPPVVAKPLAQGSTTRGDFLLSLGRLVPYKRVDLAIQAARRLGLRLVVAGDGPERARLQSLAGSGTEFAGQVTEEEAGRLMATCAAFVFCAEEDFGIAPLEANAHGAPVVAFGRGGADETMVDGSTGILFGEQSVDSVAGAIQRCLANAWDEDALHRNAERFSPETFRAGMRREIARALEVGE